MYFIKGRLFLMISVIIPTYNSQDTISRCIKSILNIKNDVHYEIILVDDGSSDNTPKINDEFSLKKPNIYSIHQNNCGVSEARNNGIHHAHGQWICFMDSDDYINAKNFERVIKSFLNQRTDLITSNINFNGKDMGINKLEYVSNVRKFLEHNYPLYGNEVIHVCWNKIYKTSVINNNNIRFPKDIEMGEDLIFVLRYLMCIHQRVVQTNIAYYNYHINNNSATRSFEHNALKSRELILLDVRKIYTKYKLSFHDMNSLRIKAVYSILLNGLNYTSNEIRYIKQMKHDIILDNNIFGINRHNISRNDLILFLMFKQPSLLLLFIFLNIINMVRKIIFSLKFKNI